MVEMTVLAPEDAGVGAVVAIKAELISALKKADPGTTILFDMTKTKRADSSLGQLLVAFRAEAEAKGITVVIKGDEDDRSMQTLLCCDTGGQSRITKRKGASSGGVS